MGVSSYNVVGDEDSGSQHPDASPQQDLLFVPQSLAMRKRRGSGSKSKSPHRSPKNGSKPSVPSDFSHGVIAYENVDKKEGEQLRSPRKTDRCIKEQEAAEAREDDEPGEEFKLTGEFRLQ